MPESGTKPQDLAGAEPGKTVQEHFYLSSNHKSYIKKETEERHDSHLESLTFLSYFMEPIFHGAYICKRKRYVSLLLAWICAGTIHAYICVQEQLVHLATCTPSFPQDLHKHKHTRTPSFTQYSQENKLVYSLWHNTLHLTRLFWTKSHIAKNKYKKQKNKTKTPLFVIDEKMDLLSLSAPFIHGSWRKIYSNSIKVIRIFFLKNFIVPTTVSRFIIAQLPQHSSQTTPPSLLNCKLNQLYPWHILI